MQRESEKDRKITCKYDPIEVNKFQIKLIFIKLNTKLIKGWRLSNKCKMVRQTRT